MRLTAIRVVRLPLEHCPTDSPRLVVADARWKAPTEGPFTKRPADVAPSEVPLVLWIRVTELDTPDELTLREIRATATECRFELVHLDFEGILGANVRECGAIEMQLQPLAQGTYVITQSVSRIGFANLDHPDKTESRETVTERLEFSVS